MKIWFNFTWISDELTDLVLCPCNCGLSRVKAFLKLKKSLTNHLFIIALFLSILLWKAVKIGKSFSNRSTFIDKSLPFGFKVSFWSTLSHPVRKYSRMCLTPFIFLRWDRFNFSSVIAAGSIFLISQFLICKY